jgi:hypothetical protein
VLDAALRLERGGRAGRSIVLYATAVVKDLVAIDFFVVPTAASATTAADLLAQPLERHENVFFVGPAGVGKSHLAQALGHEACRRGYDVLFMPAARALAQLAAGRADGTYERRLTGFARPHLLILDDFGLKPLRPPAPEDLYEIIAERYEKGSMIVASNRAFVEWPELFGEPLLASAALDRLAHAPTRSSSPARATGPAPLGSAPPRRSQQSQTPAHEWGGSRYCADERLLVGGGTENGPAWISMSAPRVDQTGVSLTRGW